MLTTPPLRQIVFGIAVAFVLVIVAGFVWIWRPAIAPIGVSEGLSVRRTNLQAWRGAGRDRQL